MAADKGSMSTPDLEGRESTAPFPCVRTLELYSVSVPTLLIDDQPDRYKLGILQFERIRFFLTATAVYFATLGFSNIIIAHDVLGDSNGTHSVITDIAKGNRMFFQMFALVNIFGFATSSVALLVGVRGKLKSEVMFLTCSVIASLCMALSFSVLVVVCVFVSLGAIAVTGSNI